MKCRASLTNASIFPLSTDMSDIATQINARSAASLIAWWRDMGVDSFIDEVPEPWLGRGAAVVETAKPVAIAEPPKVADALPATLAAFTTWLMTSEDIIAAGPPARRIAPSGDAASGLMIITDMPEAVDRDRLLTGPTGILFDKMLAALGRDRASIYLASIAPGRPATGMIDDDALASLGEIMRHHVALAAPKWLWVMGRAPSRAILTMSEVEARGRLHKFNHNGGTTSVMASLHPRNLLQSPHRKAAVWADMQNLMQGMTL
jgi:uracil-DNA glycosylase